MADDRIRDFTELVAFDSAAYLVVDKTGWSEAQKILASTVAASSTPGGADTQVQFNESGALGGDAELVWDTSGKALTLSATGTATLVVRQVSGGDEVLEVDTTNKRTKLNGAAGEVTITGPMTIGGSFHVLNTVAGVSTAATALFSAIDASGSFGANFASSSARGTAASPATVQSGDVLFGFNFSGYTAASIYEIAAQIRCIVADTPGSGDIPGKLEFLTTPDGSAAPTIRQSIYEDGHAEFGPGAGSAQGQVDIIGDGAGTCALYTYQPDASAAPVMLLAQDDVSEEWLEFDTTIGVGNATEAVGGKTLTTTHFLKITITGVGARYIPAGTIA